MRRSGSGQIKSFIFPYLGQLDRELPNPPADLVRREEAHSYPTDFNAMPDEWIDRLSLRGEQLTLCLARAYIPDLIGDFSLSSILARVRLRRSGCRQPSPEIPLRGIAGLGLAASIPRARERRRCATASLFEVGGARALPWHPQQEQNRHPPIFGRCAPCQTGRSPLPIFFLLPLTRSRRRAGAHARTLRRTP